MNPTLPRRRIAAGLVLAAVATLAALSILVFLGSWQLQRAAWKQGLIATLTERLAAPPAQLPPPQSWPGLDAAAAEFRRVAFTASFDHAQEAMIFTGPSALRPDAGGIVYWVMTPARLPDGAVVMVNRGFVPEAGRDPAARREGHVAGPVALIGVLRWPEPRALFTPADDPVRNLWFVRDHRAIAAAKGLAEVAPFYVDLESPSPPGGFPRPGALQVKLSDNHLGYAVTWFGLALALLAVFIVWAFRRRR